MLIWSALIGVMALLLPGLSVLMEAYSLSSHVHAFDLFSARVQGAVDQSSFSAPGSRMHTPVPRFEGLSAEILHDTLYIDFDHPRFSARKTREIHSPIPLEGTFDMNAARWEFIRTEEGILIQSES